MGLKAKWTIICDDCGISSEKERRPEDGRYDGLDMWSGGIPDEWLQIPEDEATGRLYLFFHDDDCYKNWLRSQGRMAELEEFENAVWMA